MAPTIPVYTLDITTNPLGFGIHGVGEVDWRRQNLATWNRFVMNNDATVTNTVVEVVDGMFWGYGTGGAGTTSERRDWYLIPGTEGWIDAEMTALIWGGMNQLGNGMAQHGLVHRAYVDGHGQKGAIVWHDTIFGIGSIQNLGVWYAQTGGVAPRDQVGISTNLGMRAFTAGSRTSNVVTLTGLPTGHRLEVGTRIFVTAADGTYNGDFPIETVGANQITYRQGSGGVPGDDAASGAGTVTPNHAGFTYITTNSLWRTVTPSAGSRTTNVVTFTGLPTDHPFNIGDRVQVDATDNTYDGFFKIHAVTDTSISYVQVAANDADAGATVLTKIFPYWLRTRYIDTTLEAVWWPYSGYEEISPVLGPQGPAYGDPMYSIAVDTSGIPQTPVAGAGGQLGILVGHVGASQTYRVQYGPIYCRRLR